MVGLVRFLCIIGRLALSVAHARGEDVAEECWGYRKGSGWVRSLGPARTGPVADSRHSDPSN